MGEAFIQKFLQNESLPKNGYFIIPNTCGVMWMKGTATLYYSDMAIAYINQDYYNQFYSALGFTYTYHTNCVAGINFSSLQMIGSPSSVTYQRYAKIRVSDNGNSSTLIATVASKSSKISVTKTSGSLVTSGYSTSTRIMCPHIYTEFPYNYITFSYNYAVFLGNVIS